MIGLKEGGTCRLVDEKTLLHAFCLCVYCGAEAGGQALAPRLLSGLAWLSSDAFC